jgi:endoribonuclease Dicer
VIFSTPQILLNEVKEKKILLEDLCLLVFDEAHHAVKNTAYNQLMRDFYWTMSPSTRPKVFGMTASPGACDDYYSTLEKIGQLCLNLSATIQMPLDSEEELRAFSGEPQMDLRETKYTRDETRASDDMVKYLRDLLDLLPNIVKKALPNGAGSVHNRTYIVAMHEIDKVAQENNLDDVKHLCTHMKACFESWETLADLGHVYAAAMFGKCVAAFVDQVHSGVATGTVIKYWLEMVRENAALKRVLNLAPFSTSVDPEILLKCPKVAELVDVLQFYKENRNVRIIVFTKMRSTAFKLRDTLVSFDRLGWLRDRIGVLVGHGQRSGEQGMKFRQQIEICDKFEAGQINLLIATSVAEEGLDIPACNVVIRYDVLETVTNFVQSRGRARARNSDFVYIFREATEEKSVERIQFQEKNMRRAVREIMGGVISFQNTLEALSSVDARPFVEEDCVNILRQYCLKKTKKDNIQERYMFVKLRRIKI